VEDIDIDYRNKDYSTPLIKAIKDGHISIIRLLLKRGADVNAKNISGNSPLSLAAEYRYDLVVEEILK
jgi:ankyrin repeat protein